MPKRLYGTGGITWLGPSRALLRVYVGENGSRRQRTRVVHTKHKEHGGRKQASEELEAFAAELAQEQETAHVSPNLGDAFLRYIDQAKRLGRKQSTLESYRHVAGRLTEPLKSMPVDKIGSVDIDNFYETLDHLGPATVRHTHAVITAVLNQGVKWKWLPSNPAVGASVPRRPRRTRRPVEMSDVAQLVTAASEREDPVLAMAISLGAIMGCRRGELCGLRWEDWDASRRAFRVERQWTTVTGGQVLTTPKGSEEGRWVHIGSLGTALVDRYRQIQRDKLQLEPDGWLLSHDGGTTPLSAKALTHAITALGKRLGIRVTPHMLRHSQSTQSIAAGIDVDTAARRSGHTTEVMLATYVHGSEDKAIAAADVIEARLVEQGLPLDTILSTYD